MSRRSEKYRRVLDQAPPPRVIDLLVPEALLPVQWHPPADAGKGPVRKLCCAVLLQAVEEYRFYRHQGACRHYREVVLWFRGAAAPLPFAFVCEVIGLSRVAVLEALQLPDLPQEAAHAA